MPLGTGTSAHRMSFVWLLAALLACWRVTHLVHAEAGPWGVLARLRDGGAGTVWGEALACFLCLSAWVALPLALLAGAGWGERALLWPALSAGAILIERAAFPLTFEPVPDYHEDEEA